ncbi:MAG: UDP-N-acetylglucosamine 1-carboxyvinyltransferase [Oceanococcaceae bacterium]
MDSLHIDGPCRLNGEVRASGAKNAALPIMAACLLTAEPLRLQRMPDLVDVRTTGQLLAELGVTVEQESATEWTLQAAQLTSCHADYELVRKMRASILVLGPLLARMGEAEVSLPGGCAIGARPVQVHIDGLRALGADVQVKDGYIRARATQLRGARVVMEVVSVTGTEVLMMAAALAEGDTVLENAAREPEVVDLALCLRAMGAQISGEGTATIRVRGVPQLHAATHRVLPDRIETGTYLVAGALTRGTVTVTDTDPGLLDAVLTKLVQAGAELARGPDWVRVDMGGRRPRAVNIHTAPHPAFPTDMQAQFCALNAIADGVGVVTETVFENRFQHVLELSRMGADIRIEHNTAVIAGREMLDAAPVMATDLRASASLVIAALAASGTTVVNRIYHLDRGYEHIETKLASLGATVRRVAR